MKTEDLHKKLSNGHLRNVYAKGIKDCPIEYQWLCWTSPNDVSGLIDNKIEQLKLKIKELEKDRLTVNKTISTMNKMKSRGWEDWDISDEIDYNRDTYIPLIGTREEYQKTLKLLDGDNDEQ